QARGRRIGAREDLAWRARLRGARAGRVLPEAGVSAGRGARGGAVPATTVGTGWFAGRSHSPILSHEADRRSLAARRRRTQCVISGRIGPRKGAASTSR